MPQVLAEVLADCDLAGSVHNPGDFNEFKRSLAGYGESLIAWVSFEAIAKPILQLTLHGLQERWLDSARVR